MTDQQLTNRPTRRVVRQLAEVRAEHNGVLSVYADLDPSVFPTPRHRDAEIESLIGQASDAFVQRDLDHDERNARTAAVERVREALRNPDILKDQARAVGIFAAPQANLFEVIPLGHPVPPLVVTDETSYLRPLANEAGPRTWAVLLVDRRRARLLFGGERRLVEIESFEDDTPSHQKQGGWSAERYQRHSDEAAAEHFDNAARALFEFFERTSFDALAIAAPGPDYDEMVGKLHNYLKERLAGRVHVEIDFPSPQQVLEEAAPLFAEAREKAIADLLHTVEEAPRDRVAQGAPSVFDALFERRVDKLIVRGDYEAPGVRCPECGWLGMDGAKCPYDEIDVEQSPDVIDDAVDLALLQAARVIITDPDAEAQPDQPIVALLRY
jgi:peptide chain release factor subunit 1